MGVHGVNVRLTAKRDVDGGSMVIDGGSVILTAEVWEMIAEV